MLGFVTADTDLGGLERERENACVTNIRIRVSNGYACVTNIRIRVSNGFLLGYCCISCGAYLLSLSTVLVWGLVKLGGRVCGLPVFLCLLCGFIHLLSYECCAAFRFGVRKLLPRVC